MQDDWETPPSPIDIENPFAPPKTADLAASGRSPLNPWLSIWLQPRATIRQIVDTNPRQQVLLLAALGGVVETLDRASMRSAGDMLPLAAILGVAALGGPIFGIVSLYIGGWVLRWSGAQLGGQANAEQVRAAIAWSGVPSLFTSVVLIPQLAVFGRELFTTETPIVDSSNTYLAFLLGTGLIETVGGIWGLVTLTKCLGEVHRFSAWRGLGSLLLVLLLVFALVLVAVGLALVLAR